MNKEVCQRCSQPIELTMFEWNPVLQPGVTSAVMREHNAPCGLPCIHTGAFLVGFDEGVHGGPKDCPRCRLTSGGTKMDFGDAIKALKAGKLVARKGWNGKSMHIYLEDMLRVPIKGGIYAGSERKYEPVIVLFTAQATHQAGWNASQADILAEDWNVVEP